VKQLDELKIYRDAIDSIDKDLIRLIEKRLEICLKVGQYKKEKNIAILNEEREQQVLQKNLELIEDNKYEVYIKEILQSIMDESKKLQSNS
jgi:chorismate mutase/prephenate dehydratase